MKDDKKMHEHNKHETKEHAEKQKSEDMDLLAELEKLRSEREETHQKLLRALADLENFKKMSEQRQADFIKFANVDLIKQLLPIYEIFGLAIETAEKNQEIEPEKRMTDLITGLKLVFNDFREMLKKHGVEKQDTDRKKFDPKLHEAVSRERTEDLPDGTIIQELRAGYTMNNKVIRPAMVKIAVSKTSEDTGQKPGTAAAGESDKDG